MPPPQPLRRNVRGYLGETIDIDRTLDSLLAVARETGWHRETWFEQGEHQLWCLHRRSGKARRAVYLSAGIHGNEPAGPLATLELLKQNQWPADAEVWIFPCLNPAGFRLNTRGNAAGVDLNRDYRQPTSAEVRAHVALLERLPDFDLAICLHEDWEAKGFYLYELNATGRVSFAESIIEAVSPGCPIDPSGEIDGRRAAGGIIRPEMDPRQRPEWPEAFYLFVNKTRLSFTMESPSDFELPVRVRALTAASLAALDHCPASSRPRPPHTS